MKISSNTLEKHIFSRISKLKRSVRLMSDKQKKKFAAQCALGVFFLIAIVYTCSCLYRTWKADEFDLSQPKAEVSTKEAEQSAERLNLKAAAFAKMRADARHLAAEANNVGRCPIGVLGEAQHSDGAANADDEFAEGGASSALYTPVPTVVIKGIITSGGVSVCVMDIDGEESGKVYRTGDTFGKGRGRIMSVNATRVLWEWDSTIYRTNLQ